MSNNYYNKINKGHSIIYIDVKDYELNTLYNIEDGSNIVIFKNNDINFNEYEYFNEVKKILTFLGSQNGRFNVLINVEDRKRFTDSGILDIIPKNIDLKIKFGNFSLKYIKFNDDIHQDNNTSFDYYSLSEYLIEELKLDNMLTNIKDADISPFEKYIAVFNIVKQFKEYKESDAPEYASQLKFILDNEYIVCIGFSDLLSVLLQKVGVPCKRIGTSVDVSYDSGFTVEDKVVSKELHARNIIMIDDDKYNIHGIYLCDSTFDNNMNADLYFHTALTFDENKESKRMEGLINEDLLLDFHDINEFNEKISYYFKMKASNIEAASMKVDKGKKYKELYYEEKKSSSYIEHKMYNEICFNLFNDICNILKSLDYNKYLYFQNKYGSVFALINGNEFHDNSFVSSLCNSFLSEYAAYIIPLSNNRIKHDTVMMAAAEVKKKVNHLSDEDIIRWKNETERIYSEKLTDRFPYEYDDGSHNYRKR